MERHIAGTTILLAALMGGVGCEQGVLVDTGVRLETQQPIHTPTEADFAVPPDLPDPGEDAPGEGELFADCMDDAECISGYCFPFWGRVDEEWVQVAGICSFETWESDDPDCLDAGGTLYMPGCALWYCLPDCEIDDDCDGDRTCGGTQEWNEPACGYW